MAASAFSSSFLSLFFFLPLLFVFLALPFYAPFPRFCRLLRLPPNWGEGEGGEEVAELWFKVWNWVIFEQAVTHLKKKQYMLRKQEHDENKEKRHKKSRFGAHCVKLKRNWVNVFDKPGSDTTYVKDTFAKAENKKAIELAHLSQLKSALLSAKSAFHWEVHQSLYSAIRLALTNKCTCFWIIFDTKKFPKAVLGQASTFINTVCQPVF